MAQKDLKLIGKDKILTRNQSYNYKNVCMNDSKLSLNDKGIIELIVENDMILNNGKIDFCGPCNSQRMTYSDPSEKKCLFYGKKLNKIFSGNNGEDGDSCDGGNGGCGIKIQCNRLILRNSSIIDVSGRHCVCGSEWWCGAGESGAILIICNEFYMDNNCKLLARSGYNIYDNQKWTQLGNGTIVIKINKFLNENTINFLIYGYLRNINEHALIDVICNLCILFYNQFDQYKNYKIYPQPIFVDDEWNKIHNIVTKNRWKTGKIKPSFPSFDDSNFDGMELETVE